MEEPAATSYPVALDPAPRAPPHTAQLGQAEAPWRVWARWTGVVFLFVAFTLGFGGAVYQAQHSPRDLALVITAYYLLALLYFCLRKLELIMSSSAAWEDPEPRRTRFAVWMVSVALANTFALRVADATPSLALKLTVWGLTAAGLAVVFYFIFRRPTREMSPEQRV